ncbi:TolC family protein [Photobacterium sp. ZSDE20]|uniref:TolC family protein n=1 Tax=Photobacterium pectinilyticum TaxID=2906793 RepID=A0ABT1MVU4_9GAMM|nr:TolC family protein [Photobacterium sp. ZSDE20]MCQ1056615.1 TolC family protein [Photobacterium sp. ZSDE20]MDD1820750.1 TolC family protein [Photobacterium sp. ZSDE20]
MYNNKIFRAIRMVSLIGFAASSWANSYPEHAHSEPATLKRLINWAVEHDVAQQQIQFQADAISEMGIANSQLMDPKVKVGIGGLPVDSFAFDEDPMTNISVGLMQQFGRGDSLSLLQKQSRQQAGSIRKQADIRKLDVTKAITTSWIELAYLEQSQRLIKQNQDLFRELTRYLSTNYGVGASQVQDLIQAELQVNKIDDQLQSNQQMQQQLRAQLSEWLGEQAWQIKPKAYPQWQALQAYLAASTQDHYQQLASHPNILVTDELIKSSETGVEIANESYQPQFGVEVMYAHRQADRMDGSAAPDLVSAYVTVDLPLFTEKRQDRKLSAAQHQVGAAKTQRDLMLRQMHAQISAAVINRDNTLQRLDRYRSALLKQAKEKTQAVERGYQNNTSQLDEYIRAASEELAIELEQARLAADLQQTNNTLAYLLNKY